MTPRMSCSSMAAASGVDCGDTGVEAVDAGVDGGDAGVDGGGVGPRMRVGEGELCSGAGVDEGADAAELLRAGDVAGVLFAGSCAARLMAALLLVADGAGPLVLEPASDRSVPCGLAPVRPAGAALMAGPRFSVGEEVSTRRPDPDKLPRAQPQATSR
jgi:hypothetical protein